jgi:hypothetical protein
LAVKEKIILKALSRTCLVSSNKTSTTGCNFPQVTRHHLILISVKIGSSRVK